MKLIGGEFDSSESGCKLGAKNKITGGSGSLLLCPGDLIPPGLQGIFWLKMKRGCGFSAASFVDISRWC